MNNLLLQTIIICLALAISVTAQGAGLNITSSQYPDSNKVRSFIYLPDNKDVLEGIKFDTVPQKISVQVPFKFELEDNLVDTDLVQWDIRTYDKSHGRITVKSDFTGSYKKIKPGRLWQSKILGENISNRHILLFSPKPQEHQPPVYKKGRAKNNERRKYGGGTKKIDDYIYNPKIAYEVTVRIKHQKSTETHYTETIKQDDIDLLRQEYINHFGRARYGRGKKGLIPVPFRHELTKPISQLKDYDGGSIFSSSYSNMVDNGLVELSIQVANAYNTKREALLKHTTTFVDLNDNPLEISTNKLWFSSGWRNPERNEWYSNAINGIHQRGAAIDILPSERPGSRVSAASYWLLWEALKDKRFNIPAYWQLERHGRPMKTKEYTQDIEPKNGIPDAFDIADHLHIQMGNQ